jgi:hypothetical protein
MTLSNTGRASKPLTGANRTVDGASPGGTTSPASSASDTAAVPAIRSETALAVLLEAKSPAEVDLRVGRRLLACGISIVTTAGNSAVTEWDEAADADHGRALAILDASLTPAPEGKLVQWFTALRAITKGRNAEDFDLDMMLEIYIPRMSEIPADIAKHLCLKHRWSWFPEISALEDEADRLAAQRRIARMIVQRRSEGREVFGIKRRDAGEGEREVSPEQRERVAEMVAGLYPTHRTTA